jgi:hypothetical protein
MNVRAGDSYDHFTFIVGDCRYRCRSSIAHFLSPRVSQLHCVDASLDELRLKVQDANQSFEFVLNAAGGGSLAVDSSSRQTFLSICAALWNSELCESVLCEHEAAVTIDNVADRLGFLSATGCDISAELEFIASHFYDFMRRPDSVDALPFSIFYEIIGRESLRVENGDSFYDFIRNSSPDMFCLLEFVRSEYCSTDVILDFFDLLCDDFAGMNGSICAGLCARLTLQVVTRTRRSFSPSMKTDTASLTTKYDMHRGIIGHLTRACGGSVHDHDVVEITSGSFAQAKDGVNPHSGAHNDMINWSAKYVADPKSSTFLYSTCRQEGEDIPHTKNNWLCCDFKERRIVPTHYTIRTNSGMGAGGSHLKSWVVETSTDGESWREVDRKEDNEKLNGESFTVTFAVAGGQECRFIRLVNIGRNHWGHDRLYISGWEVFGSLIE